MTRSRIPPHQGRFIGDALRRGKYTHGNSLANSRHLRSRMFRILCTRAALATRHAASNLDNPPAERTCPQS